MAAAFALNAAKLAFDLARHQSPTSGKRVCIVDHGLHAGLAFAQDDLPPGALPIRSQFRVHARLEIGWGDAGFYRAERITLDLAARALLRPTPAVMHVVGFDRPTPLAFAGADVRCLLLENEAFDRMIRAIDASFSSASEGAPRPIAPGLYGFGRFYPATGSYHLFRTCNQWTAEMLRAAGLPVAEWLSQTSFGLMAQIRLLD